MKGLVILWLEKEFVRNSILVLKPEASFLLLNKTG